MVAELSAFDLQVMKDPAVTRAEIITYISQRLNQLPDHHLRIIERVVIEGVTDVGVAALLPSE